MTALTCGFCGNADEFVVENLDYDGSKTSPKFLHAWFNQPMDDDGYARLVAAKDPTWMAFDWERDSDDEDLWADAVSASPLTRAAKPGEAWEQGCPPRQRGWEDCAACTRAFPLHELVKDPMYRGVAYICRDDVEPTKLVRGTYEKVADECTCDRCVGVKWAAMTGGRSGGRGRGPRAARGTRERPEKASKPDPTVALREALAEPKTTAELAAILGVTQRSVQMMLKKVDAVETRDGRSIRWSLPS
jgi:hypothetical protein